MIFLEVCEVDVVGGGGNNFDVFCLFIIEIDIVGVVMVVVMGVGMGVGIGVVEWVLLWILDLGGLRGVIDGVIFWVGVSVGIVGVVDVGIVGVWNVWLLVLFYFGWDLYFFIYVFY